MKLRICGLAFILIGLLSSVGSAETPIERGSYLVNTIGACGNCHARDTAFNRIPDLAGGMEEDGEIGHVVMPNITPDLETGIGKWTDAEVVVSLRDGKRPDGSIIGPPMPIAVSCQTPRTRRKSRRSPASRWSCSIGLWRVSWVERLMRLPRMDARS